jgi:DegV family protein with EDD domain
MKKVAVVTDSSATIPRELLEELDIHVVPLLLNLEGKIYTDGVDITPTEFFQQMRRCEKLPTTSTPSIGDFVRVYARLGDASLGIISIHLPSNLSGVYLSALKASELVDGPPILVMDSRTVSMAQGFVVIAAARKAAEGASLEEVAEHARQVARRVRIYVMLETLEYLHRGGRIGEAASLLGSLLHIKPVLSVLDGQVKPLGTPRTRKSGMQMMLREMEKEAGSKPIHAAIVQADAPQEAQQFKQLVQERLNCLELYVAEFTPVMGAHSGPGILGVAYYVEEEERESTGKPDAEI